MTKVKICGITNEEDTKTAVEAGADAVGVIVNVPVETPRKLGIEKAEEILCSVPLFVSKVVVIMPKSIDEAVNIADRLSPDAIQLHGEESLEFISELRKEIRSKIIKVLHVDDNTKINDIIKYAEISDAIMLDTKFGNITGGTGRTHDWTKSKMICDMIKPTPMILSGGLNPENVRNAIESVRPYAVDVSSGVESIPGKKDAEKIKMFLKAAKINE